MTKRIYLALLALTLAMTAACSRATSADDQSSQPKDFIPAPKALAEAAKLYSERDDLKNVRKSLEVLSAARVPDERNFDVEVAFAKSSYFLGSRTQLKESEAEKILKEGLSAAKIAIRLNPEKPDGHFWAAAILGEQSKRAPLTTGLVSVSKIREGFQKVIEIDPAFQASSAYLGLGQLELNSMGLAGGKLDRAIDDFEKGLKASPDNAYFYAFLAKAYFADNRDDDAKRLIRDLQQMKPDPNHVPEYEEARMIADDLLKKKA